MPKDTVPQSWEPSGRRGQLDAGIAPDWARRPSDRELPCCAPKQASSLGRRAMTLRCGMHSVFQKILIANRGELRLYLAERFRLRWVLQSLAGPPPTSRLKAWVR